MARDKSRQWLQRLLAGETPTTEELKRLPLECAAEGLHHDYKAGKLLEDKSKDPAGVLREYVAAFANADGGFLVVGYDQRAKEWDGARAPGGGTLSEWGARVLATIPQTMPRITTATLDGRDVLLVAVPRCRSLVPVVKNRAPVYYLRLGDTTLAMPPYLVSDLMLARRHEPQLALTEVTGVLSPPRYEGRTCVQAPVLRLTIAFENAGLSFASDVRAGLVAWSIPPALPAPLFLAQSVAATKTPSLATVSEWVLAHLRPMAQAALPERSGNSPLDLGPFDAVPSQLLAPWPLPLPPDDRTSIGLGAALYLVARDATPWWFQLLFSYDRHLVDPPGRREPTRHQIHFEPSYEERPTVGVGLATLGAAPAIDTIAGPGTSGWPPSDDSGLAGRVGWES